MKYEDSHLSGPQLLRHVDGELSAHDEEVARAHLEACWECRARRRELQDAIADLVRVHQRAIETPSPPAAGPRTLLKARLAQLSAQPSPHPNWLALPRGFAWAAAASLVVLGLISRPYGS